MVQSLQLLKISGSVETVTSLLQAGDAETVAESVLARALYAQVGEEEAIARYRETLAEYRASEQKRQLVDDISRSLLAGVARSIRQRTTRVARPWRELFGSEECGALRRAWQVHAYEADAMHDEIATTVKVDHLDHVECHTLEERKRYLAEKKRPQVAAMIKTIQQLVCSMHKDPRSDALIFVDVGGGRGDLALAVVEHFPRCSMVMVDVNAAALQSAQIEAEQRGVAERITFLNVPWGTTVPADVSEAVAALQTQGVPVVVIGLHACGGLSDALLQACGAHGWSFCCCPCCFASNKKLRDWKPTNADHADSSWAVANALLTELGALAESVRTVHQSDAMHLVNAIRCQLCVTCSRESVDGLPPGLNNLLALAQRLGLVAGEHVTAPAEPEHAPSAHDWDIRIVEFPRDWSGRNMIIAGRAPLR